MSLGERELRQDPIIRAASGLLLLPCMLGCAPRAAQAEEPAAQPAIRVKPVFLVPADASGPSSEQRQLLLRHLEWCRSRYRELLLGRDTFAMAEGELPEVLEGVHTAAEYLASPGGGSEFALIELFERDGVDRFSCPFVYVVLFCGTGEEPKGGGTPINGGANCGGGIVILAAENLSADVGFQACLQHEIGHAFGLAHADAYGWDMRASESLMSYNPAHRTHGFEPSPTPGRLLPEELRVLDANEKVFPSFWFDPERDLPPGYSLSDLVPLLAAVSIRGQPDYTGSWDGK